MTPGPRPDQSKEACPACSRFTGMHLTCPYCGEDTPRRPLYRLLRLTAFTLSLIGLAILLLLAWRSPPQVISIAAIRPAMNHDLAHKDSPP
ncbi:MAG: hypothetical protein WCS52_16530 [bacterium]